MKIDSEKKKIPIYLKIYEDLKNKIEKNSNGIIKKENIHFKK